VASDAAVSDAVIAEVGALPDIGRREAGGWLVPHGPDLGHKGPIWAARAAPVPCV